RSRRGLSVGRKRVSVGRDLGLPNAAAILGNGRFPPRPGAPVKSRMLFCAAATAAVVPVNAVGASQGQPQAISSSEDRRDADKSTPGKATKAHPAEDEAIVVTGVSRAAGDVLGGVSVLDEEELAHDMKPSLGDTLADLPGVSASSFGPSASRPILRGEQGERVRVLVDGIGSLDLSSTDPDHAVTINPLTAQRIEVLRGPGALMFGSSAIGGVVNVIDSRIPRSMPK